MKGFYVHNLRKTADKWYVYTILCIFKENIILETKVYQNFVFKVRIESLGHLCLTFWHPKFTFKF